MKRAQTNNHTGPVSAGRMVLCVCAVICVAGNAWAQEVPGRSSVTTRPAVGSGGPATRPVAPQRSTTRPAGRARYTAPGAVVRGMSLGPAVASLSLGAYTPTANSGRALSEASVTSSSPLSGAAGQSSLSASTTSYGNALATQSGLGQVARSGLGFASTNTIFRLRPNAFTGANGVAGRLATAGFPGSATAGVRSFRR